MKPGHLDTAIKIELGNINTTFYWFINLKKNVDYKITVIHGQPILYCIVPYLITLSICLDADSERTPLLSSKSFSKSDNSSEESTRSIFRSFSTQKKLTLLCLGISNAFGYMALGVMSPVFPQMVKQLMEIFQFALTE